MKCFRNLLKQCKYKDNEDGKLCEDCRYEPKTNHAHQTNEAKP